MTDDEFRGLFGSPHQQLAHARVSLDLFEKDWGRRATSTVELCHWANLQAADSLRFRIARRVRADQIWTKACRSIWQHVPAPLASRAPLGQRIRLTLAQAAQLTGHPEAELFAAVRQGRITAVKDVLGHWYVERAELARALAASTTAQVDPNEDAGLDALTLLVDLGLWPFVSQGTPASHHIAQPDSRVV